MDSRSHELHRVADKATVIVSNRGPVAYRAEADGSLVATRGAGGLAGALWPLVEQTDATWVSCAITDADRRAAAEGRGASGAPHLVVTRPDPEDYHLAYDVVSNGTLWFCLHHLFDGVHTPRVDQAWFDAWDAYRRVNRHMADVVAEHAPERASVLVQDYHWFLVAPLLARLRPDCSIVHFSHTPFADPAFFAMLPGHVGREILEAMGSAHAVGFHTEQWLGSFRRCHQAFLGGSVPTSFVSPLTADPDALARSLADPAMDGARRRLRELVSSDDRRLLVRVDRMELSKNALRGFLAFEELLDTSPEWHGRVTFFAATYPSRQGVEEYARYQREVLDAVERINERFGHAGWQPVVVDMEDDYHLSLAALERYDVLLVNPVRDGLNLVAKEGPLVNRNDGVLVLSDRAGSHDELHDHVVTVDPYDISQTAGALGRALAMPQDERRARLAGARASVTARRPMAWMSDLLHMADTFHA